MPEARRIATVIGHPIAHSRSPVIHRHWIERYEVTGDYRAVDVGPNDLDAWLAALDPAETPGGNVTVPHKEAVHRWLGPDRLDGAARATGSVNTLWFEGDALRGGSTDGAGLLADLDARAPEWRNAGHALVIGAGGAARAVVHALGEAGLDVTIANRTVARAEALAAAFGTRGAVGLHDMGDALRTAGLVVNTASLGMAGTGDGDGDGGGLRDLPHLDPRAFHAEQIAYDIVYVPLQTPFLRAARAGGATGVDGLGMLLHQAVPGFGRWFGVRPEVTPALRALVEQTL